MDMNYLTAQLTSVWTWYFFILGAVIGSFLNVCIRRIPQGHFLTPLRSQCACGKMIPSYLNIPIVSFLWLRGKAQCCGRRLPAHYLMVEILTACLFVLFYWKFPFVYAQSGHVIFDQLDFLRFFHAVFFTSLMIICSFIDFELLIIPDVISLPMIIISPLVAALHPDLDLKSSLVGLVLGGGILYMVAWLYWLLRRGYGLGFGDVKLLAAIGGWLGYQALFPTLLIGSVAGSIVGVMGIILLRRLSLKSQLPFGPFLSLGALIHLGLGEKIRAWLY